VPNIVSPGLSGAKVSSDIELAYRSNEDRAVVAAFAEVVRKNFGGTNRKHHKAKHQESL
jgi:hypothetical protein